MVNERCHIANIKDIEDTYNNLKTNSKVNAPALYNAAKYYRKLGKEVAPLDSKGAKMLSKTTTDANLAMDILHLLWDIYKVAVQSTGVHILVENSAEYDEDIMEMVEYAKGFTIPYSVEFEVIYKGKPVSMLARLVPSGGTIICTMDFWTGKTFKHFDSFDIKEDGTFEVYDMSKSMFDTGVVFDVNDFKKLMNQERTAEMAGLYALSIKAIMQYNEAMNSIPEVVTKVSQTYTKAKGIKVVEKDKPTDKQVKEEQDRYTERIIDLNKYVINRAKERKAWQGGHHASPVPHSRSGYWRRCKNGTYLLKDGQFLPVERGQGNYIWVNSCEVKGGSHRATIFKI